MNIPFLSLLGFTLWTLFLLIATVGVYRFSRIFAGTAGISKFPSGDDLGDAWYGRTMRAHANCLENLPIFSVLVFAAGLLDIDSGFFDWMAAMVLPARIAQSLIHVSFVQTDLIVSFRFFFYLIQIFAFLAMTIVLAHHLF
jgi:uncharacterized MAPEG superfamily protein